MYHRVSTGAGAMKQSLSIGLILFAALMFSPVAQAKESVRKLIEMGGAAIYPGQDPAKARQFFTTAAQQSSGPLKGWCLLQVAETYEGAELQSEDNRRAVAKIMAEAKRLIGKGNAELTQQMQAQHYNLHGDFEGETYHTETEVYADRALLLLREKQGKIGFVPVAKMLDDARTAAFAKKFDEATRFYKQALSIAQSEHNDFRGTGHTEEIDSSLWELVGLYKEHAQYADATELVQAMLARDHRLNALGEFKRQDAPRAQAADHFELGSSAFMQKNYAAAEQNYIKALKLRESIYGKGHAVPLRVENHLARVYTAENRTREANALLKQTAILPTCPRCKSNFDVKPYSYGNPRGVRFAHYRQEFAIGGCRVSASSNNWYCIQCHKGFRATSKVAVGGQAATAAYVRR